MKFLDWLFGKGWDDPEDNVRDFNPDHKTFRPVPKWTHAGKAGKTIYCPECGSRTHVHNFAWSTLVCSHCKAEVRKHNWLLPAEWESDYLRRKNNG